MRVGVFTNAGLLNNAQSGNSFLDALRRNLKVTEVHKLNAQNTRVILDESGVRLEFKGEIVPLNHFDLIVTRRWDRDDIETIISLLNEFEKAGVKVFDNNLRITHYYTNKKADAFKYAVNNLPMPKTFLYHHEDQFADATFPMVMKGITSGQGANVFKVRSYDDVRTVLEETGKGLTSFLFQEFINYVMDLRLVVVGDEVVGAMRRIPGENEFRANFSLGGDVEKFEPTEEMKALAIKAAKVSDLDISGVDILVDAEGKLYLLETNRNPGFKGIAQAIGEDVTDKVVEFIFGKLGIK